MATNFELITLAKALTATGNAINDKISDHTNPLPFPQVVELADKAAELFKKSNLLIAQAVIALQDDVKASLQDLQAAGARINTAIAKTAKIQKIVNIATSLVGIAGTILGGDLKDIPGSVQKLLADIA